jgi:hypothetical protein
MYQGNLLSAGYRLFLALKQNRGGNKFRDDGKVEVTVLVFDDT